MSTSEGTLVSQNNSVKRLYFEGDFYSQEQIREIQATRKHASRKRALKRLVRRKRKPVLLFGLNTIKA